MKNEGLRMLLSSNNIKEVELESIIYDTFLLTIFENISIYLKDRNIRIKVLSDLRTSRNSLIVIEKLVKECTGCNLKEQELKKIYEWLMAHFRKQTTRKRYSYEFRDEMLTAQGHKCRICGCYIDHANAELDHIIAWDLVGDELSDNLQMLCNTCNERKGKSITYLFKSLLLKNIGTEKDKVYDGFYGKSNINL